MAEGSVEKQVEGTPEAVWALAGSFDGVEAFFPGIESFRLEGDDRIIGMFGLEVRERLLARDDEAMTLEYSVVDGVPLDSHRARISVAPAGSGSLVTWWYDVEPESMAPVFGQTYTGALDELAKKFA